MTPKTVFALLVVGACSGVLVTAVVLNAFLKRLESAI